MSKKGDYCYERGDVVSQADCSLSEKLNPALLKALCTHNKKPHTGEALGRRTQTKQQAKGI